MKTFKGDLSFEELTENLTWFTQVNNLYNPLKSCYPTSVAFALTALGKSLSLDGEALAVSEHLRRGGTPEQYETMALDDKIWLLDNSSEVKGKNPSVRYTEDAYNEVYAINEYVLKTYCDCGHDVMETLTDSNIANALDAGGIPIMGSGLYAGHMISVIAINDDWSEIGVADPFGLFWAHDRGFGMYKLSNAAFQNKYGLVIFP